MIRPAFATHNALTAATIMEWAPDPKSFEFQRLHGMGEGLFEDLVREQGYRCRIYAPVCADGKSAVRIDAVPTVRYIRTMDKYMLAGLIGLALVGASAIVVDFRRRAKRPPKRTDDATHKAHSRVGLSGDARRYQNGGQPGPGPIGGGSDFGPSS